VDVRESQTEQKLLIKWTREDGANGGWHGRQDSGKGRRSINERKREKGREEITNELREVK